MRFIELRPCAAISFLFVVAQLLLASSAPSATHPKYGGTLRVELHATSVSLNQREWQAGSLESAANERLAALVFERLVALDNCGRFQPVLATEWSHDGSYKRWRFSIRAGVKFSDGAALTAEDIVTALQPLLPATEQISSSGDAIVVQSSAPMTDLLEQLASVRYFVYRVLASGAFAGTGPFVLTGTAASAGLSETALRTGGAHLLFRANEEAWSGRPFLNAIDVTLGVAPLRAMFDLQLGKADLIELSPELVPRARQAGLRLWTSDPVELYALRFDDAQRAASDVRLREAFSLSLDRGTMANVLLQKQAEPAAALLPQWLSGYAFLFNVDANLERAKELRRTLPANEAAVGEPLRLRVDPSGDLAKLLGERVAVNARQASILVQVINKPVVRAGASAAVSMAQSPTGPASGVHLFAWHYSSLSSRAELDSMFAAYNLTESSEVKATSNTTNNATNSDHEQLYARERRVLEERRVLPLIVQAETVGLAPTVRDWMPARWGEWHLADVWLETSEPAPADIVNKENSTAPVSAQPRATAPGAKP
jgi:MarR-like DNA-binding transcriptional regulator SgrR of sgrS sRNA